MSFVEKIKEIWDYIAHPTETPRDDQNHVMTDDEKLDQAVDESFPASDPPAHNNFN